MDGHGVMLAACSGRYRRRRRQGDVRDGGGVVMLRAADKVTHHLRHGRCDDRSGAV